MHGYWWVGNLDIPNNNYSSLASHYLIMKIYKFTTFKCALINGYNNNEYYLSKPHLKTDLSKLRPPAPRFKI